MLFKLLSCIDKSKFECAVISISDNGVYGEKIARLGIPVDYLNINPNNVLSNIFLKLFQFVKLTKKHKPDIVQGWMYHANFFSILTKLGCPKAIILFNIRHGVPKYKNKLLTKLVIKINAWFSFVAKSVVNNSKESIKLHENIGFCKKNSIYIPNGFDINTFRPNINVYVEFRRSHGLDNSTKIIGSIARFHPDKNHIGLLTTFHKIKLLTSSSIILAMCGPGINTDNGQLMKEIERLSLKENCLLLGSVDASQIMPAFDVYLSASSGEGFPNVIGEAMACGVPCVATDVGDCKDIVAEFGMIGKPGDYDALAKYCIKKLAASDEEKIKIRQHIVDHYSIQSIIAQYENLYSSVLAKIAIRN